MLIDKKTIDHFKLVLFYRGTVKQLHLVKLSLPEVLLSTLRLLCTLTNLIIIIVKNLTCFLFEQPILA